MKILNNEERERVINLFTKVKDPRIRTIILNTVPLDVLLEIGLINLSKNTNNTYSDITEYEKNVNIPKIICKRLKYEKTFIKENCDKILKFKDWDIRILAIPYLSLKQIIELGLEERNDLIVTMICTRLTLEKDVEIIKDNARRLINAKHPKVRMFVANIVSIKDIMKMAMQEEDYSVINIIIDRLESEGGSDFVKNNYYKLANANSWKIRNLYFKQLTLEELIEYIVNSDSLYYNQLIISKLTEQKDTEELRKNIHKLTKSKNKEIRQFVAEVAPISNVIEMAVDEVDYDVVGSIIFRLELEKNTDDVIMESHKLVRAKDYKIRQFAADIVSSTVLFDMALEEECCYVVQNIIHRLSSDENAEMLKKDGYKLATASDCQIRLFSIEFLSIEQLFNIAMTEEDIFVVDKILKRLEEKEKENFDIIRDNCYRLLDAKKLEFKLYATKFLSIKDIDKIPVSKCDKTIAQKIMNILE